MSLYNQFSITLKKWWCLHKNNVILVIKSDHRLLLRYLKYHAPFQDTASSRARCLSTSTTLLPNPVAVYRKKKVCVCVSFADRPDPCHAMSLQSPRLRHYRSKHQIRYMPSKRVFSMCCIQ